MFTRQRELLTFLFAGEDTYLTQSLIPLELLDYLYYRLKKNDYQTICYVKCYDKEADVVLMDDASAQSVKGFWGYSTSKTGMDDGMTILSYQLIDVGAFLKRRLEKQDDMAVIFRSIKEFSTLVESCADFRRFLTERGSEIRDRRNNLILILCPPEAEGSCKELAGEDSVFIRYPELSPKLYQRILSHHVDLYQTMYSTLGSQCIFLTDLDQDRIRCIVREFLLFDNEGEEFSDRMVEDAAAVIYCYLHSPMMRAHYPNLAIDSRCTAKELKRSLPRTWKTIRAIIAELREDMARDKAMHYEMHLLYPELSFRPVQVDIGAVTELRTLKIAADRSEILDHRIKELLDALVLQYETVYSSPIRKEMMELTKMGARRAITAHQNGDAATCVRCLNLLAKCAEAQLLMEPGQEENWNKWTMILDSSELICKRQRVVRDREEKIELARKRRDAAAREVKRLRMNGADQETDPRVQSAMNKAVGANREMEYLTDLNRITLETIAVEEGQLSQLDEYVMNFMYFEGAETMERKQREIDSVMEAMVKEHAVSVESSHKGKYAAKDKYAQMGGLGKESVDHQLFAEFEAMGLKKEENDYLSEFDELTEEHVEWEDLN